MKLQKEQKKINRKEVKMNIWNGIKKIGIVSIGVLMLGASLTGALASTVDLNNYPYPFVNEGIYNPSTIFVVGSDGKASDSLAVGDIITSLQFESRVCEGGEYVGGVAKEVVPGFALNSVFASQLEDGDIDGLFDGEVRFQGDDYDTRDMLILGDGLVAATALSSSDDDYGSDFVLEANKGDIKYYYVFDGPIDLFDANIDQPLSVKFLGKSLHIVDVVSDGEFTARVGAEHFLDVGDSVVVEGKTVTLVNVGTGNAVVVDVDGVKETVKTASETVNGIAVKVEETFYESNKEDRSATLIIGKDTLKTFSDGDAYIDEDEDEPLWVWDVDDLSSSHPTLGIINDFVWNDDSDNPVGAGDCIELPNNYLRICNNGFTDAEYSGFEFGIDEDADFSDVEGFEEVTSADALYLSSDVEEGFVIRSENLVDTGSVVNPKSDEVWLWDGGVFYEDNDRKVQLAGYLDGESDSVNFVGLNFGNTRGDDAQLFLENIDEGSFDLVLRDVSGDELVSSWAYDEDGLVSLGNVKDDDEPDEVVWNGVNIGTKDKDLRTSYGMIVENVGSDDEVKLLVPDDQVFADISIVGTDFELVDGLCSAVKIDVNSKLDSEIVAGDNRLILVGGPCANQAVTDIFGLTCEDWDLEEGEALVRFAETGNRIAMLVAGTTALDTRRAAKAVANFRDYGEEFSGTDLIVRGSGLDDGRIVPA